MLDDGFGFIVCVWVGEGNVDYVLVEVVVVVEDGVDVFVGVDEVVVELFVVGEDDVFYDGVIDVDGVVVCFEDVRGEWDIDCGGGVVEWVGFGFEF